MSNEQKPRFVEQALPRTSVFLHLDPRRPGVVVPEHLRALPGVTLQVGHIGMLIPMPDLAVDAEGVRATLSFSRQPHACVLPWSAIYALVTDTGESLHFEGEVPPDLAPAHHAECSFCLAARANVNHLVTATDVSICDRCVSAHRPRSRWGRLLAWLRPRREARGAVVALPYRTATGLPCSFCRQPSADLVRGVHARICRSCIALSLEVIREH